MKLDLFRMSLLGSLSGAEAYLSEMCTATPVAHAASRARLKAYAEAEGWEYDDYDCALSETDAVFEHHLPRVLNRSFVIYLHTLVEHGLSEAARDVRDRRSLPLKPNDLTGSAIERSCKYLTKVAGLAVGSLSGWAALRDVALVRDALVHRGGRLGADATGRRLLHQVAQRSGGLLSASGAWNDPTAELEFGSAYCLHAVRTADTFFNALLAITRADIAFVDPFAPS